MNLDTEERKIAYEKLKASHFPLTLEIENNGKNKNIRYQKLIYSGPLFCECLYSDENNFTDGSYKRWYPRTTYRYVDGCYDIYNATEITDTFPFVVKYDWDGKHWIEIIEKYCSILASSKPIKNENENI